MTTAKIASTESKTVETDAQETGMAPSRLDQRVLRLGKSGQSGRWLAVFYVLAVVASLFLPTIAAVDTVEEWTRDLRIATATPPLPQSEDIVIVTVDEDTLDRFPYRFPVDRAFIADLIEKFDAAGVRAIGIDMLFDRPTEPEKDARLKAAIANAKTVVMPIWAGADQDTDETRRSFLSDMLGDRPTGYGVFERDRRDHAIRAFAPIENTNPDAPVSWHFAASLARALGADVPATDDQIRIDWRGAPREADGGYYSPFPEYPAFTFTMVPADWLQGKIVMIGAKLADIDRHQTPFNVATYNNEYARAMPGVMIHAHILSQLLDGRRQGELSWASRVVLALIACALGIGLAIMRTPLWIKVAAGTIILTAYGASAYLVFYNDGPMVPVLPPVIGFLLAASLTTVFLGRQERTQRALIRTAFSKYVPAGVVARLDRDPSLLELGGERRTLTLLFTDLEGFTTLSEGMDGTLLGEIINDYLDGLGNIILSHGGTIDKFLGDGSMSFFGAPESAKDDADRAVACALAIQRYSDEASQRWQGRGIKLGRTRIGIHTGPAVVGNFGGLDRFEYTALGDVVNTAARLESANKYVRTAALASAATKQATSTALYRPVGNLILPGKHLPIESYEPVLPDTTAAASLDDYERAFAVLDREDRGALGIFEDLAARYPDDTLIAFHRDRLKAGGTGVTVSIESK